MKALIERAGFFFMAKTSRQARTNSGAFFVQWRKVNLKRIDAINNF
jgi:hypothetical protein